MQDYQNTKQFNFLLESKQQGSGELNSSIELIKFSLNSSSELIFGISLKVLVFINISSRVVKVHPNSERFSKGLKQAGAELGQTQLKLGLAFS